MSTPTPGEPKLPEVRINLVTKAEPVMGTVVSTARCTAGKGKAASFVRHVAIDVSGTALAGAVLPGQAFGVVPPGLDAKGRPHNLRLYSVASPTGGEDGTGNIIATTVKRTIDEHWDDGKLFLGVASNFLCDLKPGEKVSLTGPSGKRFLLPADLSAHDYVFFATGTGIAPFRGMLTDLLRARADSRIVLVMGSAYTTDLLYHDDFLRAEKEHANFTYLTAISREKQADGTGPHYVQDRIGTHERILLPLLCGPRTVVYVCGLAGMELGIFQSLARRLDAVSLSQYLTVDPAIAASVDSWDRKMIHRQLKATRRFLTETY